VSLFVVVGCGAQQQAAVKAGNECEVLESREPTATRKAEYSTEALTKFRERIEALLRRHRPQGTVGVSVSSDLNKVLVELGDVDANLIDALCSQVPQDSVVFLKRPGIIARADDPRPKR
jgi:hypothetical protein